MSETRDAVVSNLTPRNRNILSAASQLATSMGHNYVGTEHLLLALIRDDSAIAAQAIAEFVSPAALDARLLEIMASSGYNTPSSRVVD